MWNTLREFFFQADPESIHEQLSGGLALSSQFFPLLLARASGMSLRDSLEPKEVLGLNFRNPLGLAAGFDKNAEIVQALPLLGFGFCEIGTVTPRPQPGNPKPRLFRLAEEKSLFNCLGFNGQGARIVSGNLERARRKLPPTFRVGVNVGKNKDTPLDQAFKDYESAILSFEGLCDYVCINVSSPNTEGLRSLQSADEMKKIVSAVLGVITKWSRVPPLFVKLAPDLSQADLESLIQLFESLGVSGLVLGNTDAGTHMGKQGGFSGRRLKEKAREQLVLVRSFSKLPVISVGGIDSAEEAVARLGLGADLIQVYTAWVYEGPRFPKKFLECLRSQSF